MTDDTRNAAAPALNEGGQALPGGRRTTMNEVALEAGVSQTTVSLVLNEVSSARFSADTRKRVLDAAERLNYRTTRRRLGAREAGEGTIALVVDEISTDPWMALAMDGIRETAWERGISVAALTTRGNGDAEQAILRQLIAERVIGLVYGTISTRRIEAPVLPRPLPLVLLNCHVADHAYPCVVPAEVIGGTKATERLLAAGHTRIGYINGEPWMEASRDRLRGYRRALAGADIAFDPELVRNGNWEPSTGYQHTLDLMQLADPPTAIFAANDMMAFGCYEALAELGKRIPDDVAVIGYDDREISRHLRPPLTTVVLPHYAMGIEAAECLFDLAAGHTVSPQIKVEGQLIERQSV